MLVMGFDPGPTWVGWALIDCSNPSAPKWLSAGKVPALGCARMLADRPVAVDLVAVEVPSHASLPSTYGNPAGILKRLRSLSSELIATGIVAGRIIGMAEGLAYPTLTLTAQQWRQRLTSKVNASDATIKTALAYILRGTPDRTNAHERDGAGVAWAAWKEARLRAMSQPRPALPGSPR